MPSQGRRPSKLLFTVLVRVIIPFLSCSSFPAPVHSTYPFSSRYNSNYGFSSRYNSNYGSSSRYISNYGYGDWGRAGYYYFPDHHDPSIPSSRNGRDYGYLGGISSSARQGSSGSTSHSRQSAPEDSPVTVNVDDFVQHGADDTKGFMSAWKEACSSKQDVNFIVPSHKLYRLKPVDFDGPCQSQVTVQILGTLEASDDREDFASSDNTWLRFRNIDDLVVEGGGTIDGNGKIWWENSCKIDKSKPCKHAPTAVTFEQCNNLVVEDVTIQDAQQMHVIFQNCINVETTNLMISSPGYSPNTDGIHVTESQNVRIRNSVIKTGDDCISIVSGSRNIIATGISCGPGHGISIGSLGEKGSDDQVSNVKVDGATFDGSSNGLRIKTWQGGAGYARNVIFQNIVMRNASNPIIIDQYYCDQDGPCPEQKSAVQVSNVLYRNIHGTSASDVAIDFKCSKTHPCQGIHLQNVDLVPEGRGEEVKSVCQNIMVAKKGTVSPTCTGL